MAPLSGVLKPILQVSNSIYDREAPFPLLPFEFRAKWAQKFREIFDVLADGEKMDSKGTTHGGCW
jgi:hypothetical protein